MIHRRFVPILLAALVVMQLTPGADAQQAGTRDQTPSSRTPDQLIESLKGSELFRAYCAACHGTDAKGAGPAASSLKAKVPDLTRIAQRRGGNFPAQQIEKIITGEETVTAAHGSREMPVWGPFFGQIQRDQDLGKVRTRNLAGYLESLQVK